MPFDRRMTEAEFLAGIDPDRPVLIAGPTGAGKSDLALKVAEATGGVIVNADALQVYGCWRVLTARPGPDETARAPHALYGHVPAEAAYSVGHWLREAVTYLERRPVIVGGTGLYFAALTEGLAEIPPTPAEIRAEADQKRREDGAEAMLAALDPETRARIDPLNPARIQRAWEVLRATGRGLAAWQAETGAPALPLGAATPVLLAAERDWLAERHARRFDQMLAEGALDEARANLADWDPSRPASRAIGAPELVAHLRGEISLAEARDAAIIATRQYAKRQRTWFRRRMADWPKIQLG